MVSHIEEGRWNIVHSIHKILRCTYICVCVSMCIDFFVLCSVHVILKLYVSFYQFCLFFICFYLFFSNASFCVFLFCLQLVCCVVLCCVCMCVHLHVKVGAHINTTHTDFMAFRTKWLHISIISWGLSVKIFYSFPFSSSVYQFVIQNLKLC